MDIRRAHPDDADAYVSLVCALADFEHLPPPDEAAQKRLVQHAFADPPKYDLWIVELENRVVCYAVTFVTYSTFRALPSLYIAAQRGCGRFEWSVLDWNQGAQRLYEGLGAVKLDDWRLMRVDLPDAY